MYSMKDGCVGVSPFGKAVPWAVQTEANAIKQQIVNGGLLVFKGPIMDQAGALRIPAGHVANTNELEEMDWLVQGVDGTMPKSTVPKK